MTRKADELVAYIQERCLWQFASRAFDREENIDGVLTLMGIILSGGSPVLKTPMDRLHFANANHLASEVKSAFPWLKELHKEDLLSVISGVIARIHVLTVKQSMNAELHQQAY